MEGQLLPAERIALNQEVANIKPKVVLEIGTWKGGGSTLQITSAIAANGYGYLHTCEINQEFYLEAVAGYIGSPFSNYLTIHNCPSHQLITYLLAKEQVPDFIFMDGPEDPDVAMDDLKVLEPRLQPGAIFSMHDWLHDLSTKQLLIKPYLESSPRWTIYKLLTPPESVGLVFARYGGFQ